MNRSRHSFLSFLLLGMLLVLMAVGVVLFSWLLLLGSVTGFCLYVFASLRQRFFRARNRRVSLKSTGRIIEHNDIDPHA